MIESNSRKWSSKIFLKTFKLANNVWLSNHTVLIKRLFFVAFMSLAQRTNIVACCPNEWVFPKKQMIVAKLNFFIVIHPVITKAQATFFLPLMAIPPIRHVLLDMQQFWVVFIPWRTIVWDAAKIFYWNFLLENWVCNFFSFFLFFSMSYYGFSGTMGTKLSGNNESDTKETERRKSNGNLSRGEGTVGQII